MILETYNRVASIRHLAPTLIDEKPELCTTLESKRTQKSVVQVLYRAHTLQLIYRSSRPHPVTFYLIDTYMNSGTGEAMRGQNYVHNWAKLVSNTMNTQSKTTAYDVFV